MEKTEPVLLEKKYNTSILIRIVNFSKRLCIQAIIILIITLIYIKYNNTNYSDTLVFFSFGLFISIFLNATLGLIYKKDFIINKYTTKLENQKEGPTLFKFPFLLDFLKTITKNNNKTMITYYLSYTIGWHILLLLLALYYVKSYIIAAKKTTYPYINAFVYFILFILFNIYIIDIFKIYNKKLEISNNEFKLLLFLITVIYILLLYYFETIKLKNKV
jgi:hypothetical protein